MPAGSIALSYNTRVPHSDRQVTWSTMGWVQKVFGHVKCLENYDKWTEDLHLQVATLCRSVGQGMPLTGMMVLALTDPQELVD